MEVGMPGNPVPLLSDWHTSVTIRFNLGPKPHTTFRLPLAGPQVDNPEAYAPLPLIKFRVLYKRNYLSPDPRVYEKDRGQEPSVWP